MESLGYPVSPEEARRGIARTRWPGRFSCIGEKPVIILDGAHNEDAALRLRESVESYFPGRRLICIMGVFRDKEYDRIAEIMCPLAALVHTVTLPNRQRSLPAEELAEAVKPWCPNVRAEESIRRAAKAAAAEAGEDDIILVFGSLSYLEEARQALLQTIMRRKEHDRS